MTPERYKQVMQIVDQLLDRPVEERAAILDLYCNGDDDLRRAVEQLLNQQSSLTGFLEHSPLEALTQAATDSMIGRRIGPYRVVAAIGRGGMGAVYKAVRDDDEYKTEVAIKLIKRGMDTDYILRRFRNERQILANLNHPNIARLLDGGTSDDGLPYFVMECIEGRPIDDFCNEQALPTSARLALFRTVCAAVQHAHQNLVVHRDLKPSNILITTDGTPKLLDFGIAKLLQSDEDRSATALTATELRVMTPDYASPEQVSGASITTVSDVYSLGVVLYELLTGQRPYRFKSKSPEEVARVICEEEPPRPSRVATRSEPPASAGGSSQPATDSAAKHPPAYAGGSDLRGDLDAIVMMALRKEPERRYASIEQLSEDIRRYLDGLPVNAHADSFSYRAAKFVSRHRAGAFAAAVIVLLLVGGIAATTWQAQVARRERARAERRFNDVRKLANSFMFEVNDEIDKGPTQAKELLVKRALEYLDSLAQEVTADAGLQRELASAYERIGDLQGNSYNANLGDTDGALKSYRKSLEMRQRLIAADSNNAEVQRELAASYQGLGDVLYTVGDLQTGVKNYEEAVRIRERLVAADPRNVTDLRALAENYTRLGDIKGFENYSNLGDVMGSLDAYQKQMAIDEQLAANNPADTQLQFNLAVVLTKAGLMADVIGDINKALANERRALTIMETITAQEPNQRGYRVQLQATRGYLRFVLADHGQLTEAIDLTRKTLSELEAISGADPKNTYLRRGIAGNYNSLGSDLLAQGNSATAVENHRRALTVSEAILSVSPNSEEVRTDVAIALERLGTAQFENRDPRAALESFRKALAIREELLPRDPNNARTRSAISSLQAGIAKALSANGDLPGALEACRKSIALAEELAAQAPMNIKRRAALAARYLEFGKVYEQLAEKSRLPDERRLNWQQAQEQLKRSLAIWNDLRDKGILIPANARKPDEAGAELHRCEAALAK